MRVGFTGSRHGIDRAQMYEVRRRFVLLRDHHGATEVHHGDCVEADAFAANLAAGLDLRTVAHPPDNDRFRAFHPSDEVRDPLPYLDRDRVIVETVDVLVATPRTSREELRSGTWFTVRRARARRIGLMVVGPDGFLLEAFRPGMSE